MILTKNPNEDIRGPEERILSDLVTNTSLATKKPRNLYSTHTVSFSPIMRPVVSVRDNDFIIPISLDQFAPVMINNSKPSNIGMVNVDSMRLNFSVGWWENPFLRDVTRTPTSFSTPVYFGLGSYDANYGTALTKDYKFRYFLNYRVGDLTYNANNQTFFLQVLPQSLNLFDTIVSRPFIGNSFGILQEQFTDSEGHKLTESALKAIIDGEYPQLLVTLMLDSAELTSNNNNWLVASIDAGAIQFTPAIEINKTGLLI